MNLPDTLIEKIIVGIAAAATLGGGTTVLTNWKENGEQNVLIQQALAISGQLDRIETTVVENGERGRAAIQSLEHFEDVQLRLRDSIERMDKEGTRALAVELGLRKSKEEEDE